MGYFAFFIISVLIVALVLFGSSLKAEKEKILREAKAEREAILFKARNDAYGIAQEARIEYEKAISLKAEIEKEKADLQPLIQKTNVEALEIFRRAVKEKEKILLDAKAEADRIRSDKSSRDTNESSVLGTSGKINLKDLEIPPDRKPEERKRTLPYRASFKDFDDEPTSYSKTAKENANERRRKLYREEIKDAVLTDEFKTVLARLENTNGIYLLTGRAGTGKSTLIRIFLANSDKRIGVVATTGIAALNIKGDTIHRFFGFPARMLAEDDLKKRQDNSRFLELDTLVIDEVSMLRSDMVDALDLFLRNNRDNHAQPFGGVQVILVGDLLQLPPILSSEEEAEYFGSVYKSPWFFDAEVFKTEQLNTIELTEIFRQSDKEFISILDACRTQTITFAQINKLNSRVNADISELQGEYPITLTPTNSAAAKINERQLNLIDEPIYEFQGIIEGDFPERLLPTDYILRLKKGAQVMMTFNASDRSWVNGTICKIHNINEELIEVEIPHPGGNPSIHRVAIMKQRRYAFEYDRRARMLQQVVVGAFTQYPLKLAWAITIHKSQGLTFNAVNLDIGTGAFCPGQTYVALSRCRSLKGLSLKKKLAVGDITADHRSIEFYRNATYI